MIAITLTLLSLTAGAFLLGWTKKNDGGLFLKIVSYVVILASVIHMIMAISHHMCRERCEQGGCMKDDHCAVSGKACGEEMKGKACCDMKKDSADVNEVGGHIDSKGQTK